MIAGFQGFLSQIYKFMLSKVFFFDKKLKVVSLLDICRQPGLNFPLMRVLSHLHRKSSVEFDALEDQSLSYLSCHFHCSSLGFRVVADFYFNHFQFLVLLSMNDYENAFFDCVIKFVLFGVSEDSLLLLGRYFQVIVVKTATGG